MRILSSLFATANRETNYQKSSKEIKKDVNKTIKEKKAQQNRRLGRQV